MFGSSPTITQPSPKTVEKFEEKKDLKNEVQNDDDDWGAVPAFLRRSKLK